MPLTTHLYHTQSYHIHLIKLMPLKTKSYMPLSTYVLLTQNSLSAINFLLSAINFLTWNLCNLHMAEVSYAVKYHMLVINGGGLVINGGENAITDQACKLHGYP